MTTTELTIELQRQADVITAQYRMKAGCNVVLNNRLKTTAGRCSASRLAGVVLSYEIEINPKYYARFGLERVEATLRHEMTHAINMDKLGFYPKHSDPRFYRLCEALGGSMNSRTAERCGVAPGEYLGGPRYQYTCPHCAAQVRTRGKFKRFAGRVCTRCKTPLASWIVTDLYTVELNK